MKHKEKHETAQVNEAERKEANQEAEREMEELMEEVVGDPGDSGDGDSASPAA